VTHVKSTVAPHEPEDNVDIEVVYFSACNDAAEASSTFRPGCCRGCSFWGRGGHENLEAEDDDGMDDRESSEDDDIDPQAEGRRKAVEVFVVLAAASHTFKFGPSIVMKGCIHELEKLKYCAKGDGRAPGEETMSEPQQDEVVIFEDYIIVRLHMPPHPVLVEILMKFKIQLH
jgi:hypothetical protein